MLCHLHLLPAFWSEQAICMTQGSVFGLLTGSQVARFALPAPELPPESVAVPAAAPGSTPAAAAQLETAPKSLQPVSGAGSATHAARLPNLAAPGEPAASQTAATDVTAADMRQPPDAGVHPAVLAAGGAAVTPHPTAPAASPQAQGNRHTLRAPAQGAMPAKASQEPLMHMSGTLAAVAPEPAALAESSPEGTPEAPYPSAATPSTCIDVPGKQADSARRRATLGSGQHTEEHKEQPQQNGAIEGQQAAVHADASRAAKRPEQPLADVASEAHGAVDTASSTEAQPDEARVPTEPAATSQLPDTQTSTQAAAQAVTPAAEASESDLDTDGKALSRDTASTGMPMAAEAGHPAEAGSRDAQQPGLTGSSAMTAEKETKPAAASVPEADTARLPLTDPTQKPLNASSASMAEPAAAADDRQLSPSMTTAEADDGATAAEQEAGAAPAPQADGLAARTEERTASQNPVAAADTDADIPTQQSSAPIQASSAGDERGESAQPASASAASLPAGRATAPEQPEPAQAPADGASANSPERQPQQQSAVSPLPRPQARSAPRGQRSTTTGVKKLAEAAPPVAAAPMSSNGSLQGSAASKAEGAPAARKPSVNASTEVAAAKAGMQGAAFGSGRGNSKAAADPLQALLSTQQPELPGPSPAWLRRQSSGQ